MEKTYIYDVEEFSVNCYGERSNSFHTYFSTYDKAVAYLGLANTCVEKNGGIKNEDNFFDAKYEFSNGEYYFIKCNKRMLDEFPIGEA